MKAVFADTSFFLASLNPDDSLHDKAIALSREITQPIVTTGFVLLEVANAMSGLDQRACFAEFYLKISEHPRVNIIPVSEQLMDAGLELYSARKDKEWSLTDCISFTVMRKIKTTEALTHDHHFTQAGFKALLR